MLSDLITPDYLLEVSWEVCNKVGGIYTVVATKASYLKEQLGDRHILVGPDLWRENVDNNSDFIPDNTIFCRWQEKAHGQGLKFKIGRWNVPGKPIAILVDYRDYYRKQNDIFTQLWLEFGVDSIYGNGDYKENVLFSYAAAQVIKSYCDFYVKDEKKVLLQCHEWQTGATLLCLKNRSDISTCFTTHATVVGRCLAGNNLPLYDNMESYNADEMAQRFNVIPQHSMEKYSALNADVFTTVSNITAKECLQFLGRGVDLVTPNGFDSSFTPDSEQEYDSKRAKARKKLLELAWKMSGEKVSENSLLLGISGRYEYRNKGIDVFLDALSKVQEADLAKDVIAFLMIPAGHNGADDRLLAKLERKTINDYTTFTSHKLSNTSYDAISQRMSALSFTNAIGSNVKLFFIPSYLNGDDGILDMSYYDLLIGLDLTLFPSYYEPWGYTPLESLAFKIPTLTTTLAGFGLWIQSFYNNKESHCSICVVDRNDANYFTVVEAVAARIKELASLNTSQMNHYMDNAEEVSKIALWKNQLIYYMKAYSLAIKRNLSNENYLTKIEDKTMQYNKLAVDSPSWKSVMLTRHLPQALSPLEKLSKNLWWCWNDNAKALFKAVDPKVWHDSGHNPRAVLDEVSIKRFNELAADKSFLDLMNEVMKDFENYMAEKANRKEPSVGYFCMEYGLDSSLKIYSGGLGILAGDYLKESSDMNVDMVAIGLLYRYGYFTQVMSSQGDQVAKYDAQNFMKIPAEPVMDEKGNWLSVSINFPGRVLTARLWKVAVGRTDLYLLDTDYEANIEEDRQISYHLYGGDWENRLKQELLLGIGGMRALRKLGLNPSIYHCNEGHAAFIGLERLREYIQNDNLDFLEALELVRASSLFTTHTPVPAGHDAFEENMLRKYIGHYPERLKIDWETMMGLGKLDGRNVGEKFSMSHLAANISQNVNGVSWLHGKVSQDIFADMYPGYLPEELHVSHVTNGVHYPTWASKEWKALHAKVFGEAFKTHHYDKSCFEGIYNVDDKDIWETRKELKKTLISVVKAKISDLNNGNHYSPSEIVRINENIREDVLTIGFARRFATYKRATLLFSDLDRLAEIVNNEERPVQFFFAGKAHPADKAGQDLIKRIVEISKQERFIGKIVFVPGYDISLAKRLVQGVDVWMNNPTRPQEASGTSGEKAAMNGVMHFSVLDGWWVEGYREDSGWALPLERTYDNQMYQDELDSATIYAIIENEIAKCYYDVDPKTARSKKWIEYIKNTIAKVACNFTTNRMLSDYLNQYYQPQKERFELLKAKDFDKAKQIALWKQQLRENWEKIEVVKYTQPESSYILSQNNKFNSELVLNIGTLKPEEIRVEMLFVVVSKSGKLKIREKTEFAVVESKDGLVKYQASILPERTGMYQVAVRFYAYNPLLAHRQDFDLVRWL